MNINIFDMPITDVLSNQNFWQIILIMVTVFLTNFIGNIFENKRKDKKTLSDAISSLYKIGYLLEKAAYNRYECEIYSNYYDAVNKLSPSLIVFEEYKRQVLLMPALTDKMYDLYGEAFKFINELEQVLPESKFRKLDKEIGKIINYKTCTIMEPTEKQSKNMVALNQYRDQAIEQSKKLTREEILVPFRNLNAKLINH